MVGHTGSPPTEAGIACAGAATTPTATGNGICEGAAGGFLQQQLSPVQKQTAPGVVASATAVMEQDPEQQKQQ